MLDRRRALSAEERKWASRILCAHAHALSVLQNAHTIMLYASMAEEIDLFPLMEALLAEGHRIALPEIVGRGVMTARELPVMDALIEGTFGILTPDPAYGRQIPAEEIDLVIVPGAAFSSDGGRLGLGGGYYDRFLPQAVHAVRLVLAFDVQVVPKVPRNARDACVDCILTERRMISCRNGIVKNLEEEV